MREFQDEDYETDIESATSTRVMITISGDNKKRINQVTQELKKLAGRNKGNNTLDTGTKENSARRQLKRILDLDELNKLPLWELYLDYRFT